jgi:hypothetical protein
MKLFSVSFERFSLILLLLNSAGTIMLELNQMKYLNVILNSNSNFLLLALALFMGAFASSLFWRLRLSWQLIFLSVSVFCFLASVNLYLIRWIANLVGDSGLIQSPFLSAVVLILIGVPYLFSGLTTVGILNAVSFSEDAFKKRYIFDMIGILLAAFLPHYFVEQLGPENLTVAFMVIVTLYALWGVILCKNDLPENSKKYIKGILFFSLLFQLYSLCFVAPAEIMNSVILKYKPYLTDTAKLEFSKWDSAARIDVVDFKSGPEFPHAYNIKFMFYDGGTIGTNIYPFDGNFQKLKAEYPADPKKFFLRRATVAAHLLKENTAENVFLFGVGAGQELKAALMYAPKRVFANELVQTTLDIDAGRYSAHNGGIFNDPKVTLLNGEGRIQLNAQNQKFDIIQIFSNYLSANMVSNMAPQMITYLFTAESIAEYMDHLTANGILQINQYLPENIYRLIHDHWENAGGRGDFKKHIYIIKDNKSQDYLPTLLFKKSEFTAAEDAKMKWLFKQNERPDEDYVFVESPFENSREDFSGPNSSSGDFHDQVLLATDDKPFFAYTGKGIFSSYDLNLNVYIFFLSILMLVFAGLVYSSRELLNGRIFTHLYFFASGISFLYLQFSATAQILKNLNAPDLAFPITLSAFAMSVILAILIPRSQISRLKMLILFFMCLFAAFFLRPALNYLTPLDGSVVTLIAAYILLVLINGLVAIIFPVGVGYLSSSQDFYLAWLFNGLGILVGHLTVNYMSLFVGLKAILVLSLLISFVGFFLLKGRRA